MALTPAQQAILNRVSGPTPKERKEDVEIPGIQARTAQAQAATRLAEVRAAELEYKRQIAENQQRAQADAVVRQRQNLHAQTNIILNMVQYARQQLGGAGGASVMAKLPFVTQAGKLDRALKPIKNELFNNWINFAKDPKTGATGIGQIRVAEIPIFQGLYGELEKASSPEELELVFSRIGQAVRRQYAVANGQGTNLTAEADPKAREAVVSAYGLNDPLGQTKVPPPDVGIRTAPETPEGKAIPLSGATRPMTKEDLPSYVSAAMDNAMGMLNTKNATPPQVMDYLRNTLKGTPYEAQYTGPAVQQQIESWFNYRLQNPEKTASWAPLGKVPRTGAPGELYKQDILGQIATSAPGAFAQGEVSGFTGNWLPELLSPFEPTEVTRAKLGSIQQQHPFAYGAGEMGGQIAQQELLTRGLKLPAPAAVPLSSAVGGAGATPEDRTMGALVGGGAGVLGYGAGELLSSGSRALSYGARDIPIPTRLLGEKGVRVTLGDLTGKYAPAVEQFVAKMPFAGAAVRRRQAEAGADLNTAAFDTALKPIDATTGGLTGYEGADLARNAVSQHFKDTLSGVDVDVTPEFRNVVKAKIAELRKGGGDEKAAARALTKDLLPLLKQDKLSGDTVSMFLDATKNVAYGSAIPTQAERLSIRPAMGELDDELFKLVDNASTSLDDAEKARVIGEIQRSGLSDADKALMIQNTQSAPDFSGIKSRLRAGKDAYRNVQMLNTAIADSAPEAGGRFSADTLFNAVKENVEQYGGPQAAATAEAHPMLELARAGTTMSAASTAPTLGGVVAEAAPFGIAAGITGAEAGLDQLSQEEGRPGAPRQEPTDVTSALLRNLAFASVPTVGSHILYSRVAQDLLRRQLMQRYAADPSRVARTVLAGVPYAGQAGAQYAALGAPENAPMPAYRDIQFALPQPSREGIVFNPAMFPSSEQPEDENTLPPEPEATTGP